MDTELLRELATPNDTKILLCVVDGLGGLPDPPTRRSELESADITNLDHLVTDSVCGLTMPVGYGITPGSGPGHLALFGYDPLRFDIGRGVLEAFGIGVEVGEKDVAERGNFCTVDPAGLISDRRAGRIATETARPLVEKLATVRLPGGPAEGRPGQEHGVLVGFR